MGIIIQFETPKLRIAKNLKEVIEILREDVNKIDKENYSESKEEDIIKPPKE